MTQIHYRGLNSFSHSGYDIKQHRHFFVTVKNKVGTEHARWERQGSNPFQEIYEGLQLPKISLHPVLYCSKCKENFKWVSKKNSSKFTGFRVFFSFFVLLRSFIMFNYEAFICNIIIRFAGYFLSTLKFVRLSSSSTPSQVPSWLTTCFTEYLQDFN